MNRLEKIEKDLEKAREKAAECQTKVRELEKQKQEEENSQIAVSYTHLDVYKRQGYDTKNRAFHKGLYRAHQL